MRNFIVCVLLLIAAVTCFNGSVKEPDTGVEVPIIIHSGKEVLKNFRVDALGVTKWFVTVYGCAGGWYKSQTPGSNTMAFIMKMYRNIPPGWITSQLDSFFGDLFVSYVEGHLIREEMDKVFQMFPEDLSTGRSLKFVYNEPANKFELWYDNTDKTEHLQYFVADCSSKTVTPLHGATYGTRNGKIPNV